MGSARDISSVTAVVLCGGKGERLRPLTQSVPKPMVPLNGQPLLHHLMSHLWSAGISRFVLCVGHRAEVIEAFIAGQQNPGWEVVCVNSGDASMTDRILDALEHADGQVLVCYGDVLANIDVEALRAAHDRAGGLATLTVYPLDSPFGIVEFDSSRRISQFVEKPRLPYWTNIGFLLCESGAFSYLERGSDMTQFLSRLAEVGKLHAYEHTGRHLTVNTEKDRATAEDQIGLFVHAGR